MLNKVKSRFLSGKKFIIISLIALMVLGTMSCASWTGREKGMVIGATTGGVIGGIIGNKAGNTAVGAILGAAIGGASGMWIGDYMDKQAEDLESELGENATIERVGEGIKVTFDSGILFNFDKYEVRENSKESLTKFAETINKYADTNIILEGHTDNVGADEYNQELSEKRAQAVSDYIKSLNVGGERLTEIGYGETQPIADNSTKEGQQLNRRVEIAIFANDRLKKKATEAISDTTK